MNIVAEGVETEEQSKLLRLLKCDEMQGYLFGRPVPLERIQVMLAHRSAEPGESDPEIERGGSTRSERWLEGLASRRPL